MVRIVTPLPSLQNLWARYGLSAALLLSFFLQFYRLDVRTFHGDELGSVAEAAQIGRNANSLPYFALLRLWLASGGGEFWLRSLSAFAAVGTVAVTFAWVRRLFGPSIALRTALLLATAPFLLVYAQQVRFYSLALLAAGLSIWAFVIWLRSPTMHAAGVWLISTLFSLATLLLNGLLLVGQLLTVFALTLRLNSRTKSLLLAAIVFLSALTVLIPAVREFGFNALAIYTNANSRYLVSRGLALSQVAKIPFTFFFFTFGESVYPLNYWLVVPGAVLFAVTLVLGLSKIRRTPQALAFVGATGLSALALLYLVFDPLSPPTLQGAAPRYLIFLLPLFYFVLAAGTQGKCSSYLFVPLLFVNAGGIASYWYGDWAYADDLVNWRGVRTFVGDRMTADTLLLLDGRAQETANYYFPTSWKSENDYQYESAEDISALKKFPRLIMLSYDFNSAPRARASNFIQEIENSYNRTAAWSQYPLFIYVFDRKPSNAAGYPADPATGNLTIPAQIYGLEFQDLRLPIPAIIDGRSLQLGGAFSLPGPRQELVRAIPLEYPANVSQLYLLSNVTGTSQTQNGLQLATIQVTRDDGTVNSFPVRLGYETSEWDDRCVPGTCRPAYTWRKRLALLGTESYPGSWSEFNASIFAARFDLEPSTRVRSIELERVAPPGTLNVWGIAFAP